MASKIDMSLDQIIKMGKKSRSDSHRQGGRSNANANQSNQGGARNNRRRNRNRGSFGNAQRGNDNQRNAGTRNPQPQSQSRGGRRRNRRRGNNDQKPQQLSSAIQRPQGNAPTSTVRYNMKTGRVRRRRGPRSAQHGGEGKVLSSVDGQRRDQNTSGRIRRRNRSRRSDRVGSGAATGTADSIQERAALVRRLIARARKRETQSVARESAIMKKRGLANPAQKQNAIVSSQQRVVKAARKRVAAATRRSQFSASLRRAAPSRSNLKVSVPVDSPTQTSRQSHRKQLVRKYRAEARQLIEAVKTSLVHSG